MDAMHKLLLCLFALPLLLSSGCVEQRMTITSDPPGALVRISDEEIGTTPVTVDWVHPGEYEFILSRPGYQTMVDTANLRPHWYQIPGLDLIAAISPVRHADHRYVHFIMEKLVLPENHELIAQGLEMKAEATRPVE